VSPPSKSGQKTHTTNITTATDYMLTDYSQNNLNEPHMEESENNLIKMRALKYVIKMV